MNRRGVSPLIATLMLIAFSSLLGAGVMNFGKSYIEERAEFVGAPTVKGSCDNIQLNFIDVGGKPQVCTENSNLKLFLEAGPNAKVSNAQIRVIGKDDIYEEDLTLSLTQGQSKKVSVNFGSIGGVQQVKLTPYTGSGAQKTFCKALTVTPTAC